MSQENVELVRLSNALTNDGDIDAAFELVHPDIEWVIAKEHPDTRTITGRNALAEYWREWQEALPGVRVVFDRLLDTGDAVVGIGAVRGTGAGSGADVRVPIGFVFTLGDGLIARVEEHLDPAEALRAVGLEE